MYKGPISQYSGMQLAAKSTEEGHAAIMTKNCQIGVINRCSNIDSGSAQEEGMEDA